METRGFVNSETEAPKIQILLTLNLVQLLLQMAEKRKMYVVKCDRLRSFHQSWSKIGLGPNNFGKCQIIKIEFSFLYLPASLGSRGVSGPKNSFSSDLY